MKNSFKVSYVTTLPREGNSPRVTITGTIPQTYKVEFNEFLENEIKFVSSGFCNTNQTILANAKQWYTPWFIKVIDENNKMIFGDMLCLEHEVVFIKLDAWALGDTIAWIPYVEEFRRKHICKVICSTFYNDLLVASYPEIMFVKPNTIIDNVYAQYYIGATNEDNLHYSPIKVNENPLQMVASSILGLEHIEIRPNLYKQFSHLTPKIEGKYVCLSEFGSDEKKHWKALNGWQLVVDKLNSLGYKVVVISLEPTKLVNIIDMTGKIPLQERMIDLMFAKFYLGVSSGLSWLSWAMGTHTIMISDVTPNWHEFQSDITRVNANDLSAINYNVENETNPENVLKILEEVGV